MTDISIRPYQSKDYNQLAALYRNGALYGGQFDPDRDSQEKIDKQIAQLPNSILVAEQDDQIRGTVSLLRDQRFAILFRFAVEKTADEARIAAALFANATDILKAEGHQQVLVYSPVDEQYFDKRYPRLGLTKGGSYTCYWKSIP